MTDCEQRAADEHGVDFDYWKDLEDSCKTFKEKKNE